MYEMSFFCNNSIFCHCTGFLHVLWAFTAENMKEEGAIAAFQWSACRSFQQWGGEEGQKTCIGNPATGTGRESNLHQVACADFTLREGKADFSAGGQIIMDGFWPLWRSTKVVGIHLWRSHVSWPGQKFCHALCFLERPYGEQALHSAEEKTMGRSITIPVGTHSSSSGSQRTLICPAWRAANLAI